MALRAGVAVAALVVCAWFALGVRQANEVTDAAAIAATPAAGGAAAARHADSLLRDARSLNPDLQVDVLRGQVAHERGQLGKARRILRDVVRREPENLAGWVELAKVESDSGHRRGVLVALAHVRRLVPVVPPPS